MEVYEEIKALLGAFQDPADLEFRFRRILDIRDLREARSHGSERSPL